MEIKEWARVSGVSPVREYIDNLPSKEEKLEIIKKLRLLEKLGIGLKDIEPKTIKPLVKDFKIWELKVKSHRISFFMKWEAIWLLESFKKEKNKTQKQYIKNSIKRSKEI